MAITCNECGKQSLNRIVCSNCGKVIPVSYIDVSKLPEVKPLYHLPASLRNTSDPMAPSCLNDIKRCWGMKD